MLGYRSASLLERAVESLRRHSRQDWELVLVLNGAAEEVRQLGERWLAQDAFPLLLLEVSGQRPGAARNHGVRAARAPLVLFLDDDIELFQDLVAATRDLFRDPAVQAAGGANLTPPGSGALERASGAAMESYFGAAGMRARYAGAPEGPASEHGLILCNLAVRKSVFEAEGGFQKQLVSNEENLLLQRLEASGARLLHSPRLAVYHLRRPTWLGTAQQAAKYGAGRAQNLLIFPATFRFYYLAPAALLLYTLAALPLAAIFGSTALLPAAVYAGLALAHALLGALRKRDPALLLLPLVYPLIHLSYGAGFLRACFRWGFNRKSLACEPS